ncbi:hypothetical protein ASG36_21105 [Geodermatophilus sp. Leaf369]|uniref:hypothetical protein n=1 Tax=Geodermatophilus sp. Leaf369 TaxID=1736354 RepID=UPI0006F85927|nr:hypothetical protein [Geodermatophilus sp. Leaf369]KQS54131.1 hypothetical protein ASG36_21105 [Geodermatophilus sp. Leaf369]
MRLAVLSVLYRLLGLAACVVLTLQVGVQDGVEGGEVFWGVCSLVFLAVVVAGVLRVHRLRHPPLLRPSSAPLPPETSRAADTVRRLRTRDVELAGHAGRLGRDIDVDWVGVAASVEVLHRLADGVVAVEATGDPEQTGPTVDRLVARLHDGVTAHDRLTRAAAEAVAGDPAARRRLPAAAEQLAGTTRGLARTV